MCDCGGTWNYSQWGTNFAQYLNQHARMTQWIQNLHQNLPQPCHSFANWEPHAYHHEHGPQQGHYYYHHGVQHPLQHVSHQGQGHYATRHHHVPQRHHGLQHGHHVQHHGHSFSHQESSRCNSYNAHARSRSQTSAEYVSDNEDVQEEENEQHESDNELVFNADAILAFRALKEESVEDEVKSEESFEFVDTMLDENFEFVELDDAGRLQKICGKPTAPDASGDVEYDREARIVFYGERADRIAGLETSMEIMFDHLNDLHQPVVYPHM